MTEERARKNTSSAVKQQRGLPKTSIDYFPTPPWATRALLNYLDLPDYTSILEPAAGGGHMLAPMRENDTFNVFASDLHDPANKGYDKIDFLDRKEYRIGTYDWVITNPPFTLAAEFALRGIELSRCGCALLCRVAFLESVKRYKNLFNNKKLSNIIIFTERVAMVEGRLDLEASSATCYAWLIWRPYYHGLPTFDWFPPGTKTKHTKEEDKMLQ